MASNTGQADPPIDRAWTVLLGAALCMFCGQSAMVLFTFATFASAVSADTGWSPVWLAAAITPATILAAILSPVTGRFADRVGVRRMVMLGAPVYALGFILLGYASTSLVAFITLLGLLCALGFASTAVLYAQLAAGWFMRRRGLALSLIFSSTSLGVAFWSPLAVWLVSTNGWRTAYAVFGVIAGAMMLASAIFLIRDPPIQHAKIDQVASSGLGLSAVTRGATFWKIAAIFLLVTGTLAGVTVNLPIALKADGIPTGMIASIVATAGLAMLVGRLAAGVLLDRWFAPRVTAVFILLPIVALALLLLVDRSQSTYFVAAILLGLGLGSELDAAPYIVSRAFGLQAFGAIYGAIALAYGLGAAIGPGAIGTALAINISTDTIFAVATASLVVALALILSMRRADLRYDAYGVPIGAEGG